MTHSPNVAAMLKSATETLHFYFVQVGARTEYGEIEQAVQYIFAAAVQAAREEREAEG